MSPAEPLASAWSLCSREPGAGLPVLTAVQVRARLDSVLFELVLTQTYRNTGRTTLEVVYTFPLAAQAVLLGFASTLNGERLEGRVVARAAAEQTYEQALAEGDAPVMLESNEGLVTANLGNLKPGDELQLEVRTAQLLAFEQGRLRLVIPSTVAPRYGSPGAAGLQPQQVPEVSLAAEHPLSLCLTLGRSLAGADVQCPTHRCTRHEGGQGVRFELDGSARLDRDVVFVLTPPEPRPAFTLRAHDGASATAPTVVMATFVPPAATRRERVALKLLVDCSGSMAGDSMACARAAVHGVAQALGEADVVAFSRFGSTVQHVLAPSAATAPVLQRLQAGIQATEATLGGTEMAAALQAVLALPVDPGIDTADVLLITDGEIWQADALVAAARRSGQRVFAIGVGSAPAEGVLRRLADATGGACEFATPGESLLAAARRMLACIRQPGWNGVQVQWGTALWQTQPPQALFAGDTLTVFAGLPAGAAVQPVRLLAREGRGPLVELACTSTDATLPGDELARLAAAARLPGLQRDEALRLALEHQLLTDQTHCVLVHRRAAADRAAEQAELHRVASMLAAGWGGTGSVLADAAAALPMPMVAKAAAGAPALRSPMVCETDHYLPAGRLPITLPDFAQAVIEYIAVAGSCAGVAARLAGHDPDDDLLRGIGSLQALGLDADSAWLLFAHWMNERPGGLHQAAAAAVLAPQVAALPPAQVAAALQGLQRWHDGLGVGVRSRAERLRHAMSR